MWKVYCDNYLLYSSNLEDYKIYEPSLNLELNKTGSFTFTIYSNHPNYDKLKKLKSIITVYKDDYLYFRGRILNDTVGFYNERQVSCEGELAFLVDSIQRPFKFPVNEEDTATPEAYFTFLIQRHNSQVDASKQFVIGTVTVTDPNNYIARSDTEYSTTWQLLNEGLINTHGGYLWVDSDNNGNRRINYYSDFNVLSNQPVEFGKNLLSIATERKGEDIATAILPLGKKDEETEEHLTISSLPDETTSDVCKSGDFVYSISAETLYGGRIIKVVTWDDVTDASNLLRKAKETLASTVLQPQTIELSAADLSAAGYNFNSFRLGTYVTTKSDPHESAHGLSSSYLVKKLSIKLDNPSSNSLAVGATVYSFTEQNKRDQETQWKKVETNVEVSQAIAIRELEQRVDSEILQSSESILSRVSEGYYTKDKTDELVSGVSTELEQTANSFNFKFTNIETNISNIQSSADANFEEIRKYIRFENGNIILGEEGNELVLKIQNDRISFLESNLEVAYFSNRKLYVTDGEYINSLKLGKFSFLPRANGNLSFKKVVD